MKNIITIQHTESIHHTNGMIGSWTDWDITALGISEAQKIGEKLALELTDKDYVMYSSDLLRAKHTAEIVAKHLNLEVQTRQELRERNLGRCVGKSVEWMRKNKEMTEKTVDDRLFSDTESRRDEWNRLKPFFDEILSNDEENIIIVSHGDLLSVFNMMWLGLEVEMIEKFELFGLSGGVTFMYQLEDGKRFIKRMSDLSYKK